jgi:hypothetical protein
MASSLAAAVRGVGLGEEEVTTIGRAFALAVAPRVAALDDDHHPAYLHPGRSMLILMHDVGPVEPRVLVAACVHESLDEALRIPVDELRATLDPAQLDALGAIPLPGEERLLERLVTLEEGLALSVLAEWLDQLRHLHMRQDLSAAWAQAHEEVLGVWLPFARRSHPKMAVRYEHWARVFTKRL